MASHFRKFSGCFTCKLCGKKTRDVNGVNGSVQMCPLCNAKCECGNSLSDAGFNGDAWEVFDNCKSVRECEDLLTAEVAKLPAIRITETVERLVCSNGGFSQMANYQPE